MPDKVDRIVKPRESQIEARWCDWAADNDIIAIKMYNRGWPDRLVLLENGRSFFIEFKRDSSEKPRKLQLYVHALLRKKGFNVYVCSSKEEAIEACRKEQARIQAKEAP